MVVHKRTEHNFGNFLIIKYRPFTIPTGVFDEKRLISDKEYEEKLKSGQLKRNTIDPKYIQQS